MPPIYGNVLDQNLRPRLFHPIGPFGLIHPRGPVGLDRLLSMLHEPGKTWISILPEAGKPEGNEDANDLAHSIQPPDWLTAERIDRAVEWAMSMSGRVYDRHQRYSRGGYYYACLGFVYDAYLKTGTPVDGVYGQASGAALALGARQNRNLAPPPRGAWVFYDCWPYGHVALSLGDGRVIHVRTDDRQGRAEVSVDPYYSTSQPYIGWAWPQQPGQRPARQRSDLRP